MIDKAAVVLPQPLSPASPRLSPSPNVKSTPSTARTVPSWVWKCVLRPFTVRSGMLPLRGMGRTNPGTRFSERGSRTQGSALTFCLMHTQSRAHRIRGMGLSRSTKPVSSSDLRTRVRRFYAYQTASSFAIWIPFWALWIRGHLSSDFEFTLVDVAFWVGLLVFQLPVGVVADRTPRRRTIVLSELFRSAGILGYGISATFWGYVAANVVWSLGAAFSIGTSAYLYETLLEAGHESEFPRYIGRVTMIQLLSNAAGGLGGGGFVGGGGGPPAPLPGGAPLHPRAGGGAGGGPPAPLGRPPPRDIRRT